MGKRAPILPEGYNPVGDALKKAVNSQSPIEAPRAAPENNLEDEIAKLANRREQDITEEFSKQELPLTNSHVLEKKVPLPEFPTDRELKETSFRFRCTERERKRWHSITQEITGEHNQLSHFARAAFMLIENAYDELKRRSPEIQSLRYPGRSDQIRLTLYEHRIAEVLFEAIKASGRPRG